VSIAFFFIGLLFMVGGVNGLNFGQKWALKRLESEKSRSHLGSTGCGRHEPHPFLLFGQDDRNGESDG
jgi:hypothetical protein